MRISEIFHSVQGEGQFAGTPTVFVRTTGCNLRCAWCDTPYTSWNPEGVQRTWQSVFEQVLEYDCRHLVLTGGEPMLQPDVVPITRELASRGKYITVETAGTVFRDVHADLMSVSPKLSNSTPDDAIWSQRHDRLRENDAVAARLFDEYNCQLKFVIDCADDLTEVEAYLARFPSVSRDQVWLMPQAITQNEIETKSAWLTPIARERGFQISPRLHIELFGNVRGK